MKLDRPLLFLIGYRGTGKTSVGRCLAQNLGWNFVDADEELERRCGITISDLVSTQGEGSFRDHEESVLVTLCELDKHVVATGGGVVLREANRNRMRAHGKVVWLTAGADTIWSRLQSDPTTSARRPNLSIGGKQEVQDGLRERDALYRSCADHVVSTEGLALNDIADVVLKMLSSAPASHKRV